MTITDDIDEDVECWGREITRKRQWAVLRRSGTPIAWFMIEAICNPPPTPLYCAAIPMYSIACSIVQTPHSCRQTLPTCRGLLVLLISTMITLTTMLRIITSTMMLTTIAFIGKHFTSLTSERELSNYTLIQLFVQACFQRGQFL